MRAVGMMVLASYRSRKQLHNANGVCAASNPLCARGGV
jgi:hypothetical protein